MSNPLHVALVAHSFPPDGIAGVEQYTLRLARALAPKGVRVTVICGRIRQGEAQNSVIRETVQGVDVRGLVQNWPYRDLPEAVTDGALDRVFGTLLDALEPDLVAIQTLQGLSWGFPAVAAARSIPVALHLHDAFVSCASGGQRLHPDGDLCLPVDPARCGACFDRYRHREGPLERTSRWAAARLPVVPPDTLHRAFGALPDRLQDGLRTLNERGARAAARRGQEGQQESAEVDQRIRARQEVVTEALGHVRQVISPSEFLARSVTGDGVGLPRLRVVPTGVPSLGRAPRRLGAGTPLKVLFLGTWVHHKGPHVLADALAELDAEEASRIEALAVGPAPFPAYRDSVVSRSAGRLAASGPIPSDQVPDLLRAHDVVVIPSIWAENAPLVALEARAHGRPVLASDLGGLVELVQHEVDGLRFPPGDAGALAAALRRLLLEPDLLESLSATVRPSPSEDSWASAILDAWTSP
ncbi:MAG: glycosyltransferase [Deltaproteobacteria bacterium]|nr:glycosyltransferase [Deltaproteobacteria bacterium]